MLNTDYGTLQPAFDEYAQSFLHKSSVNAYGASTPVRVDFSPTASYLREVMRFRAKHASLKDKVAYFNEAQSYWERDPFLKSNHGPDKPSSTTREGRKLKIAEYMSKMKPKL